MLKLVIIKLWAIDIKLNMRHEIEWDSFICVILPLHSVSISLNLIKI